MAKNRIRILALLPLLSVASCSSKGTYVGLYVYDVSDVFMSSFQSEIVKDLEDVYPSDTVAQDGAGSQATQNAQFVKDLDSGKVTAAVVNTVDRLASSALIEKAESKQVPLVFINREPLQEDLRKDAWSIEHCFYVGGNPAVEGAEQAEIARSILGSPSEFAASVYDKNHDGKIQLAILKGEQGHQDSEGRTTNALEGLSDYQVDTVKSVYCNWSLSQAYAATKALSGENIELMIANNDAMALGAIQALQEADAAAGVPLSTFSLRHYPIIGCDGTTEGRKAVRYGYMTGTVLNDYVSQSKVVVDLLRYLISNEAIPTYDSTVEVKGNAYYVAGPKIVAEP